MTEALEEMQIPPYKEEEIDSSAGEGINSGSCNGIASTSSAASPADSAASPASCSSKDSGVSACYSRLYYSINKVAHIFHLVSIGRDYMEQ